MSKLIFNDVYDGSQDSILKWFFNSIPFSRYVSVVRYLLDGIGYGDEFSVCHFETWDEEEMQPFDGVLVCYLDDEVIVPLSVFYSYLEKSCDLYSKINPNDKEIIDLKKKSEKLSLIND